MEPSKNAAMVPTSMPWNDVGAWNALDDISKMDSDGNVLSKDVYQVDCTGTLVKADGRMIGAVGLKDMIVVDTPGAGRQATGNSIERKRAPGNETACHRTKTVG